MKSTQVYSAYVEGEEELGKDDSWYVRWREKCAEFLLSAELSLLCYGGYLSSNTGVVRAPHSIGDRSQKDDAGYDEEASRILLTICQDPEVQLAHVASLLSKFRADPNYHSKAAGGRTALHYFVANRSWICCHFMINAGADCSAVDASQQSVLSLLCAMEYGRGQERLLRLMLETMSYQHGNKICEVIDRRDERDMCALDYAVGHKNYVAIKQLLLCGSTVVNNTSCKELKQLYGNKLVPVKDCIDYKCPDWQLRHYYPIRLDRTAICYRLLMSRHHEEVRMDRPHVVKRVAATSETKSSDRIANVVGQVHEPTATIHDRRQDMRSKSRLRQVTRLGSLALDEYQQEMDDKLQRIRSRLDREYFVSFHGLFR